MIDKKEIEQLQKAVKSSAPKIQNSGLFLSMYLDGGFEKEPLCLLQLAIAILLDKPIGVLVYEGIKIPENLKKIAVAIEYCEEGNQESMNQAALRLIKKMSGYPE